MNGQAFLFLGGLCDVGLDLRCRSTPVRFLAPAVVSPDDMQHSLGNDLPPLERSVLRLLILCQVSSGKLAPLAVDSELPRLLILAFLLSQQPDRQPPQVDPGFHAYFLFILPPLLHCICPECVLAVEADSVVLSVHLLDQGGPPLASLVSLHYSMGEQSPSSSDEQAAELLIFATSSRVLLELAVDENSPAAKNMDGSADGLCLLLTASEFCNDLTPPHVSELEQAQLVIRLTGKTFEKSVPSGEHSGFSLLVFLGQERPRESLPLRNVGQRLELGFSLIFFLDQLPSELLPCGVDAHDLHLVLSALPSQELSCEDVPLGDQHELPLSLLILW